MAIVVARDIGALRAYQADWEDLAAEAVEPNVFQEAWMLLPALMAFSAGADLFIVLVFSTRRAVANNPRILTGLFVFERLPAWHRLPIPRLRLWSHRYSFLSTPLVRRGYADECISELLRWLSSAEAGVSMMEFPPITADGAFSRILLTLAAVQRKAVWASNLRTRALFRPNGSADAYLRSGIAGRHRKDLRRRRRRLGEQGRVEIRRLTEDGDVDAGIEEFLAVEQQGWKGEAGTALATRPGDQAFFRAIVQGAFARRRLDLSVLTLDERPIAVKCSFFTPPGSFAFKIAYDEGFAKYSPGMLLELDTIDFLHRRPDIKWMDSCAVPDHFMINRLWRDRRPTHSVLITKGAGTGLLLTLMPLLQFFRHRILRR